jgi:hypothetical protein
VENLSTSEKCKKRFIVQNQSINHQTLESNFTTVVKLMTINANISDRFVGITSVPDERNKFKLDASCVIIR